MFPNHLRESYSEVTRFLTNAIQKNKLANSYVFIGKDSDSILDISIHLAKILNCNENTPKTKAPCGSCINCKWLEKKEHPQAFLVINPDSKSKKEQIKIDSIRELLNTLKITSDFFRVVLFQNSSLQSLPPESSNLLLKTVEETPERTIFIFANVTRNDILPTILSRSQIIYVNKKYNSISEMMNNKSTEIKETDLFFSNDIKTSLEKGKITNKYLEENELSIKDYLINAVTTNYESHKYKNLKRFCTLYENLSKAHLKQKAFMQPKIVIEDLFLSRT